MSTFQAVTDQLAKAVHAHRTAHHHAVRESRRVRAQLQAERALLLRPPAEAAEPEPMGMAAGMPPQDTLTGLYDVGE